MSAHRAKQRFSSRLHVVCAHPMQQLFAQEALVTEALEPESFYIDTGEALSGCAAPYLATRPGARAYTAIISVCKLPDAAVSWLREAQSLGHAGLDTFTAAAAALVRARRHEEAQQLLEESWRLSMPPTAITYNTLLSSCRKTGDNDSIAFWLSKRKEADLPPDLVTFNNMVDIHARKGQVVEAVKWLERLKEAGFSPNERSYSPVVLAFARKGDTQGAGMWCRRMLQDDVFPNAVAFAALIDAFVVQRDAKGADTLLSRLMKQSPDRLDARSVNDVVRLCSRQGEHQLALKWFERVWRRSHCTGADASAAVCSYAAVGQAAKAAEVVRIMEEEGLAVKVRAFSNLAKAWAASGRIVLAVSTISKMYKAGHRCAAQTWATVLAAASRRGEAELLLFSLAHHGESIPGRPAWEALCSTLGRNRLERRRKKLLLTVGRLPVDIEDEEQPQKTPWAELEEWAAGRRERCGRDADVLYWFAAVRVWDSFVMEEEEEETLQAKVRSLEQRELRRIRQGAILQRKLEDAEARRRELLGEAQEALQERRKQKAKRERQAVQELEQELHKRLEDLQSKERRLEQDLRVEQKKRKTLEAEVHYWKSCGQILLRRDQAGGKDLASGQDTKATEMQAMELQAAELRSRIKEVERISALGRAQEVDLAARSQTLAHSLGLAESAAKASKVKVAALRAELLQATSRGGGRGPG
ncbi:unnamed protein product [Effrenium voratum]|nr:unnamed protein product [Effrenium voratum]